MKKIFLVVVIFLSIQNLTEAGGGDKPVKSEIKHVTVFLNRAQVSNTAQVYLPAGSTNLIFEELSTKIDKQSIQVSSKGNLTIMAVKHQINYLKNQTKAQKIRLLEDSLEIYQDKLAYLTAQKNVLQKEEEMILSNKSIGGDGVGVSAQKLKEISDFYRTRLLEIQNTLIQQDKNLKKLGLKIQQITQQIAEANKDANKPTSEIVVTVSAETALTANFEITYIVLDAGWAPIYDIRAKDTQNPIQLSYKANVFQNTGIDWSDVNITLSTGNPTQSGLKPELNMWYVNFYNPNSGYARNKNRGVYESNKRDVLQNEKTITTTAEEGEEINQTIADYTVVNESALATEFEIAIPYSIPSDGKPQLVDVKNYDLKTKYSHSVVPKMDYDVFLMAQMTGWEEYNLLSGKANVYLEGTFVGETYLDAANTRDTLTVSLGRDKKIVVKRLKIQDLSSKKFIGSNIKEELGFDIIIRNTKKEVVNLTVEEQIPVSKNSQIEVELIEAEKAYINPLNGKVTWKISLNPSETKKLQLKYSIKYPKNQVITFE